MKTFFTIEISAFILLMWAWFYDSSNQTTTYEDGWTRRYTIPTRIRELTSMLALIAGTLMLAGILLLIWFELP